jgi:pterin-4a-carbinolamine dehydratase/predicted enzyme related to lactoylglutathione lyase
MPYAPLLPEDELPSVLAGLPEWALEGGAITRTVRCESFGRAIELVNAVADAAERADHHPDFRIVWRSVTFRLTSKASGGITQRDVQTATEIDRLVAGAPRPFREAFPILHAGDPDALVHFYRAAFDFEESFRFPPEGDLEYAFLKLPPLGIGIGRRPSDAPPASADRQFELWIHADDADAAVGRAVSAGAALLEPPVDKPWGERVGLVADPEGFRIRIGAESAGDRG